MMLAAAPTPRVAPTANSYVFVPRLDKLDGISAFTSVAGKKSPLFRSVVWSDEVLPVFNLDVTSEPSLLAAGIDPAGPLSTSFFPTGKVACVQLKEPKEFAARGQSAMSGAGLKWKGTLPKGVAFDAVTVENGVIAGYVLKGNLGCVVRSPKGKGASLMDEAAKLLDSPKVPATWKNASGLPGAAFAVSNEAVIAFHATAGALTVELKTARLPIAIPALQGGGPSPYGDLPSGGVGTVKARVDPASVGSYARGFASQLASFCPSCDERVIGDVAKAIAPELTGQLFLRVESLNLAGSLRGDLNRYFAVRHAYLAELKNPDAVKAQLQRLESGKGVRKTANGIALVTQLGDVEVGVYGKHLCASNDAIAKQAILQQLQTAKGGKLEHGSEFQANPKLIGKALRQLSILDAVSNAELAGLFAAGTEVGPLLSASQSLSGYADSSTAGTYRAQLQWTLEPARSPGP